MKKIKSISFLFEGERVVLKPNGKGRFALPVHTQIRGSSKTSYKETRVMVIVKHKDLCELDPVLTLENDEKLRVYQGGDDSYMLARPAGIIEKFDELLWSNKMLFSSAYSADWSNFPWPDYLDW